MLCARTIPKNVGCMRLHYVRRHGRDRATSTFDMLAATSNGGSSCKPSQLFSATLEPYLKLLRTEGRRSAVERTVKYLAVCPDANAFDAVVHYAPSDVIDTICRAAYHIERGGVCLTEPQKNLFRLHRHAIATLTASRISRKRKRVAIESQKAAFPFLPTLIATAHDALGDDLFGYADVESGGEHMDMAAETSTSEEPVTDEQPTTSELPATDEQSTTCEQLVTSEPSASSW
jgi:hypothetical protein